MSQLSALSKLRADLIAAHQADTKNLRAVAQHACELVNELSFDEVSAWGQQDIENYLLLVEALEGAGYAVNRSVA